MTEIWRQVTAGTTIEGDAGDLQFTIENDIRFFEDKPSVIQVYRRRLGKYEYVGMLRLDDRTRICILETDDGI